MCYMRVSVSGLEQYERCPRQYFLERVEKKKGYPEAPTRVGRVVHRTIERLLRNHCKRNEAGTATAFDATLAHDTYMEEWTKEQGLNNQQLFTEGLQMVSDWINRWSPLDPAWVLGIEKRFDIEFDDFTLIGYIDLVLGIDKIDEDTGEVFKYIKIFDWKTSNAFMSTRDAQESLQLSVYDMAARLEWPGSAGYDATIEMLRDGTQLTTRHSDLDLQVTSDYVEVTADKIFLEESWMPVLNSKCIYCAHKNSCEEHRQALRVDNVPYCQNMHELELLAIEREQLSIRRKIIEDRLEKINDVLKTHMTATSEPLNLAGHFFKISKRKRKHYPAEQIIPLLVQKLGMDARSVLSEVSSINSNSLQALLDKSIPQIGKEQVSLLRAAIENKADTTVTAQLFHRKEKKHAKKGKH